jgi:hypothetical protein
MGKPLGRTRLQHLAMGKLAAIKVKEMLAKGEKPNLYKAMKSVGYTEYSSKSGIAKFSNAWKNEMEDVVNMMEIERKRCLEEMQTQAVRDTASYRDRLEAVNKLSNNIQLLTGKQTANDKVSFSWDGEEK